MLDAIKDGYNETFASSKKKGSSEAIEADIGNRIVYKLVKVEDDGSVLAATEDDIFESFVGMSNSRLSSYDPQGSDVLGNDDNKDRSEYVASNGNDSSGRTNIVPIQDLAVERQRLKAQIEVLDCILMKVGLEERMQLFAKKKVVEKVKHCLKGNPSTYVNASDGFGDYKRQRRPNPKYFDYDAGHNFLMEPPITSICKDSMPRPLSLQKSYKNAILCSPRVASSWNSQCSLGHTTALHKARTVVLQKPLLQTLNKDASTCPVLSFVAKDNNKMSLDNLSIRELHEAFCSIYGRKTSVKDKHWLKRQIAAGWMKQQDVVMRSNFHQQVQNKIKTQLNCMMQTKQPLPTAIPLNVGDTTNNAINEKQFQKANDIEDFKGAFENKLKSRCLQQKVTTPTILSRSGSFGILAIGSLNGSSVLSGQTTIEKEVVNIGEVVEGKRQRKPNRRYTEDETYVASKFVPFHDTRSFNEEAQGVELKSTASYSWRTVETSHSLNIIEGQGTTRRTNMQNNCNKKFSPIQRSKFISNSMKRKVGGRIEKLVKMAHTIAQASQHDAKASVCKTKFQLPTTPNIITNDMPNSNGESKHQASTVLPIMQFDTLKVEQPLVLNNKVESKQLIVTIPTANGGIRRKHHKPWTLREVMTLIEGVAQCGGGKWANIKKLAFSTVGYRTAVDLKDKWRNLLRASRAQLHSTKQGERNKQFTATIPAPILARVCELASLPNQIPLSTISMSNTSHIGQIVH